MKHGQPWFVIATLRGIGRHVKTTDQPFTVKDVVSWDADLKGAAPKVRVALDKLLFHKLVQRHVPERESILRPLVQVEHWQLTDKGLATCRSVLREQPRAKAPNPNALSTRLWSLLRLRKMLTAEEGAATLIDAGTRDFVTAQHQIAGYLRAWAKGVPDVVKVSAKTVNGAKRYVMVKEGGAYPPPTKATGEPAMPAPKLLTPRNRTGEAA